MKNVILLIFLLINTFLRAQDLKYEVSKTSWKETLGNHRAVIQVNEAAEAIYVTIDWRRRDNDAGKKALIITNEKGDFVSNIFKINITKESGRFIFEPSSGAGKYFVYFMPWQGELRTGYFKGDYVRNRQPPSTDWVRRNLLSLTKNSLKKAKVIAIQSRTSFDSFYPMEVVAKKTEVDSLLRKCPKPYLIFPEDRKNPIRMFNELPYKWVKAGPSNNFSGRADKNEYYVFQLGIFAASKDLKNLKISFIQSPFAITCFNAEGYSFKGVYFTKTIDVKKGCVQPLWIGLDIPAKAQPGPHSFKVKVQPENEEAQIVNVKLAVSKKIIKDRGDNELWRHSRLRWLNSKIGIDDNNPASYSVLKVRGQTIIAKSAQVILNGNGLPEKIVINNKNILENPVAFDIETNNGLMILKTGKVVDTERKKGIVNWTCNSENEALKIILFGSMEADGYLHYNIELQAKKDLPLKDIRLELQSNKKQAAYFMGMGLSGEKTREHYSWKWKGPQNSYWIGNYDAGIYCKLLGATYSGPLLNLYHPAPPPNWYNNGSGGFKIVTSGNTVKTQTFTGRKFFKKDSKVNFEFSLLITPVKPLDSKRHFTDRYYHYANNPQPPESAIAAGVKVINVHHANAWNPYINYPFITADRIKAFASRYHSRNIKTKIYYTIRELSNQAAELWALRSLGAEIFAGGKGGGYPWLQEHLVDNYNAQWFNRIQGSEASDAAILTSGDSRWYNYYIEGLNWLLKHTGIDGLYLDDVAFDRTMLKRIRKVMDAAKPGCLIDLHSNTRFSIGPASQYAEYFPYINKIWFGEGFMYNRMSADNWFVETSGIPFGLMGEMLQSGGNPWRGMVYGMTTRLGWETEGVQCDPKAIWKVWDDFGIVRSKMIGYWDAMKVVSTSNPSVLATVYVKDNRILIAVASWAKETTSIKLNIDWDKIGWKPKDVMTAPSIKDFQKHQTFNLRQSLTVAPAKGLLLVIEKMSK